MKVLLCGNCDDAKVIAKMLEVKEKLENMDYKVILPTECIEGTEEKQYSLKKHLDRMFDETIDIVLVINEEKNGIHNFINANTIAEIGLAFYKGKKIFLLNGVYLPFRDELDDWGIIPLLRDLRGIRGIYDEYYNEYDEYIDEEIEEEEI